MCTQNAQNPCLGPKYWVTTQFRHFLHVLADFFEVHLKRHFELILSNLTESGIDRFQCASVLMFFWGVP